MEKKKIIKYGLIIGVGGLAIVISVALYLFNKPHRDVQAASADFELSASALVHEYLENADAANQKYLDDSGDSRIMAVTGKVHSISRDMNNQVVILLQEESDKAGVSCTFTAATNAVAEKITDGQVITVKGVIRSGAGYDEDLDLYEDVILEKCDILKQ